MLNRTPYNALQDDDGSNLVGTVWNKAQIQSVLLDPVDVSLAERVTQDTNVGTVHNWAPSLSLDRTRIEWHGATQFDCTGLANGGADKVVTIFNVGGGPIALFHPNNAGSLAANRFIHPVINGPLAIGPGGWIKYAWHGVNWKLVDHEQGAWIRPAYLATRYTASAGTWVVEAADQSEYAYYVQGAVCFFAGYIVASSVTGTPTAISVALPNGYFTASQGLQPGVFAPAGSNEVGFLQWAPSATLISFQKVSSAAFGPTTNTTYAYWSVAVPIA